MSKIIAIGTAVPAYCHGQEDVLHFVERIYAPDSNDERRKLRFLYHHSGIEYRYSVIPDYSRPLNKWQFYPHSENMEPFPTLEQRMNWYQRYAAPLSMDAVRHCLDRKFKADTITHLITVSCTGMSAPGLDLELMELLSLPRHTYRTSVNFMGCYAAIHALKQADQICRIEPQARVLIVCTELCTLHFQREPSMDNIAASLLFGDGSAAVLVTGDAPEIPGILLQHFYGEVLPGGKKDMAWELASSGFRMTLSGYVPDLIREDFGELVGRVLQQAGLNKNEIHHWCIHPGGKRILEAISRTCHLDPGDLAASMSVLRDFGNMSSPTLLFVLKKIWQDTKTKERKSRPEPVIAAAFGPGITMETCLASIQ